MKSHETKILATLGPASSDKAVIKQLIEAGVNGFRINMSHSSVQDLREKTLQIRQTALETGTPVALAADLCGPKIRVAALPDGNMFLEKGTKKLLGSEIPVTHPEIIKDIKPGQRILLDDGKMELEVISTCARAAETIVRSGGLLLQAKGVNLPDTILNLPALTEKDRTDLAAAVEAGVDYVSLSFVQRPEDMQLAKDLVGKTGIAPMLIAKIEKPQAVEAFDEILKISDGIMVARGDLGVEMSVARVPPLQKEIISKTNSAGKTVITATQMLESMTENPRPTRAEASDVANAVWDGTDAVMLSGETAVGKYPVETVRTMREIIFEAERARQPRREAFSGAPKKAVHALAGAAVDAADELNADAIVVITVSGYTAQMVVQQRPVTPVIAVVPEERKANQLALLWGTAPVSVPWTDNTDKFIADMEAILIKKKLIKKGGTLIFVSGSTKLRGTDYIMKIQKGKI